MYDLIIVGAGPAGLSAAVYGRRAGLNLIVIEQTPMGGGQVVDTYEVDNYLGLPGVNGFDLAQKFRSHADGLGAVFKNGRVTAVRDGGDKKIVETADGASYEARTLILAGGAAHAKLGVPGEEEYRGQGVSYCATCDGAFFKKRDVAVVGGGDVAVEDAIFLARACKKVYLIHRRDELRAAKILQDQVMALPNVEILWDTVAQEVEGEESVQALRLKKVKTGKTERLEVDGVFVAVGIIPDSGLVSGLADCDGRGYVIAGEDGASSLAGLFVAGDIRAKKLRQIITAASDGANAITSVQEYLLKMKTESQ